jgi:hypothetical protein
MLCIHYIIIVVTVYLVHVVCDSVIGGVLVLPCSQSGRLNVSSCWYYCECPVVVIFQ